MIGSDSESSTSVGALWSLIGLHFRGVWRRMGRGARTVRGAVFLTLGILVFCTWLGPQIYVNAAGLRRADPQIFRAVGPFAILAFCVGNLIFSVGENAVAFTPAEVDFLFPGPFSRRWLLGYKILKSALGTIFTAVIFTVMMLRYGGTFIACLVGMWLTVQFMQLFAMAAMMFGQSIGQRAYSAGRRAVLVGVLAVVGVAVVGRLAGGFHGNAVEWMRQIQNNTAARVLLAPFAVFARAITAGNLWPGFAIWGTLALLIDLGLLGLVLGLDANYLEQAATVSQRRYERLQRMRRGGGIVGAGSAKWRILPLPWLAGAGPVAWRQLTGAIRSSRRLLIVLGVIAVVTGSVMSGQHVGEGSASMLGFLGVWISLFLVSTLRFDFRGDLDRIDLLRGLPIRPAAVAAGQLVTPVVILVLIHAMLIVAAAVAGIASGSSHEGGKFLWVVAAFVIPFDVLLVGIENLLFMLFPLRSVGLIAGDMQLFGRQMVVFFCKFFALLAVLGVCAGLGTVGYFLGGRSWVAFGMVAWVVLSLAAMGTVPLLARIYSGFDPSVDTPA